MFLAVRLVQQAGKVLGQLAGSALILQHRTYGACEGAPGVL